MTVSVAKLWLKEFQDSFNAFQVHYIPHKDEDWVLISPHAVVDYPCREIQEFYILRLLRTNKTWTIISTKIQNRIQFSITDPDENLPQNRRKLEIIIDFQTIGTNLKSKTRGIVVSVWRESSPKNCCWKSSGKIPLCKNAIMASRKI